MPLASVQLYVKNLIDGIPVLGAGVNIEAFVTPPVLDNLDGPKAYIQGGRVRVGRQTMPRIKGFKHLAWVVDVYLSYLTNPDSTTVDQEFAQIIDTVMADLWTTTIPVLIDQNGVVCEQGTPNCSQILNTGENLELEYPPERVPASLRMLYYTARLGVDVYEAVQA